MSTYPGHPGLFDLKEIGRTPDEQASIMLTFSLLFASDFYHPTLLASCPVLVVRARSPRIRAAAMAPAPTHHTLLRISSLSSNVDRHLEPLFVSINPP